MRSRSIAYEASCLGGESRRRGIGIYARGLLDALVARDEGTTVLLSQEPIERDLLEACPRFPYPDTPFGASDRALAESEGEFERLVHEAGAGLLHVLSPFEGRRLPLAVCSLPRVATVYDLIPLLFREHYEPAFQAQGREEFWRRYEQLRHFDRLIAISEATRADLVQQLGVSAADVAVAPPGCNPAFRPGLGRETISATLGRLGLEPPFVVYTAGIDYRKNLEGLFDAFAMSEARRSHRLVIVCALTDDSRESLRRAAERRGIADRVRAVGYVSLRELVALYNAAELGVFPSLYEGFGIPVLEAMRAGCPMVASNTSSIPELAGDAAVLVDPRRPEEIARGIDRLAGDARERERFRSRGFARAERYSWAESARRVAESYEPLLRTKVSVAATSDRIAFFSPMPPARSGVARYAFELVEALAPRFPIDVFVDQPCSEVPALPSSVRLVNHRAFRALAARSPYRSIVYQLGNSTFHTYEIPYCIEFPGIVTLHDLTLHDLVWYLNLLSGQRRFDEYADLLTSLYGARGSRIAEVAGCDVSIEPLKPEATLLEPLLASAREVVVHNRFAEECVRRLRPGVPVTRSHVWPFRIPEIRVTRRDRARMGLPHDRVLIGCFGYLSESKRVGSVLRTLRRLRDAGQPVHGLFVGEDEPGRRWEQAARDLGLEHDTTFAGPVDDAVWNVLMNATDVVVALRYPTRGESSGPLLSALGLGKPCVVSDVGGSRDLAPGTCLRVSVGRTEEAELEAALSLLVGSSDLRAELGSRARRHAAKDLPLERAAAIYSEILERAGSSTLHSTSDR